jgi:hypothetical protein
MLIHGAPVDTNDVHRLIDALRGIGRADDTTAAEALESAMLAGVTSIDYLTDDEREAILALLVVPSRGLVQLRTALLLDHWERQG